MLKPIETKIITIDTASIFVQIFGEGTSPLVLLHGNGEDHTSFSNQIEVLAKYHRVITIDSRGHGKSSFGSKPLSILGMCDDVIKVIDALSIPKVHLLGFSDGGNIAIQVALSYPDRVASLILGGANLHPNGVKEKVQTAIKAQYIPLMDSSSLTPEEEHKRQLLSLLVNEPNFTPCQIAQITQPTLVMAGDRDIILEEHTRRIASSIPNAQLVFIPDCGHFIFQKKAEIVNKHILDFLTLHIKK